jgi:long-chain acyl-CoA synthetase
VRTSKQVHDLIRSEIDALSKDIKGEEPVQDFVLVLEDFTTENGMLTPTLKVKHRVVLERYGQELDGLY